jgi:hypothetical protein
MDKEKRIDGQGGMVATDQQYRSIQGLGHLGQRQAKQFPLVKIGWAFQQHQIGRGALDKLQQRGNRALWSWIPGSSLHLSQQSLFVEPEQHRRHLIHRQPQRLRHKAHIRIAPFQRAIFPLARTDGLPIGDFYPLLLQMLGQTQDGSRLTAEGLSRTN